MIEIIHCITTIRLGGAEKQLLTLVGQQVKSGYKVTVIYLKGTPELKLDFEKLGAEVLDLLGDKLFFTQFFLLKKYLRNKKSILHAHLPRAELFCAMTKQKNQLIISKHNSERFFPKSNFLISKLLARYTFSKSSFCICISFAVRNYLIEIGEIFEGNKLDVVHYGYSENIINKVKTSDSSKNELGVSEFFVFGTIARLAKQKNYKVLLMTFARICDNHNNVKLIIVGDGPEKHRIIDSAKKLKIFEKILWVSHTDDVYRYLSAMDVFILASNYEGFGLVLLEAMQTNIPIIAPNNSSIPEVMGSSYPGLFETNNSLELLSQLTLTFDEEYRNNLVKIYEQRLNMFTPNSMHEKISMIYQRSLNFN
jgi:glycosyltransferase involved in cell wall biosynthesis